MDKKNYKILFFVSFLPIVILISYAIYSSVGGVGSFGLFEPGDRVYGLDAFVGTLVTLLVFFPLLTALLFTCFVYQIAYYHMRKSDDKKPVIQATLLAAFIFVVISIFVSIVMPGIPFFFLGFIM